MSQLLGEFEQMVLLAVLHLQVEAYGMAVRDLIVERAERDTSFGAVYSTLRRLRRKGLLASEEGVPEPVRGGRAKTYFSLTFKGMEALRSSREVMQRMSQGLEGTLDGSEIL